MSDTWTQAGASPNDLLARWRRDGRPADLAALFDAVGPELFRVALHLCRDAATAEDVLQDTFVVVLERAHLWDPSRPAMPWLVGILKNQAAMARRRAARSPDPDRAPAPSSPLDPAFEAAEAEERERLREVLKSLPEPYRGVALLRWRYGLDPAEIAEVQGVPPGTVRSWLSRALSRIKVSMAALPALLLVLRPERGLDGVRTAILRRAVTRRLPEPAEVVASGSVVVRALAGVPVGRALLAASVAVVAVGSVGWYLFGGGDGAGDSVGLPVPLQVATAPPAPKPPEAASAPPAPAATTAAAVTPKPVGPFDGVELEVLVKDAAGNPAAGAEVILWRANSHYARDRIRYYEEPPFPGYVKSEPARADSEGRALLRVVKADVEPNYPRVNYPAVTSDYVEDLWLHVSREREACMVRLDDLPKSGRATREATLEPAGRLQGTLRWTRGEILAGGLVFLKFNPNLHLAVRADEHGRFRTPLVPASRYTGLRTFVRAKDALSPERIVGREFFDGPDLDIDAVTQTTLRGRCVDAQGAPLPDLPVAVRVQTSVSQTYEWSGRTAPDGTFALGPIDGILPMLHVDGGEQGVLTLGPISYPPERAFDMGDIRFGGKELVQGVVVHPDGTPVAGALLLLSPGGTGRETVLAHSLADDVGRFSFAVARVVGAANRFAGAPDLVIHVLPVPPAQGWKDPSSANPRGRYWDLLRTAWKQGFQRGPFCADGNPLRIVLGGLRVTLRCVDADAGTPIPLKMYRARLLLQGTRSQATEGYYHPNEDGTFFLFAPKAGTYVPEFQMEGYEVDVPETVDVTEERETILEVKLRKKP